FLLHLNQAEVQIGLLGGVVLGVFERFLIFGDRLFGRPLDLIDLAEIIVRLGITGVERKRLLEFVGRLDILLLLKVDMAERVADLFIVGVDLDRFVEFDRSFLHLIFVEVGNTELIVGRGLFFFSKLSLGKAAAGRNKNQ